MPELPDLTPEMKAAIGKSQPPVMYEVTSLGIRTYARAVGFKNPLYYDVEAAKAKGHRDLVAPPGYLGMPIFDPNKSTARVQDFPSPFTRNLNGGNEIECIEHVYAGDVLEATTTLTDLKLVPGRLGQMLIRSSETVYKRVSDGKVVAKTRNGGISY